MDAELKNIIDSYKAETRKYAVVKDSIKNPTWEANFIAQRRKRALELKVRMRSWSAANRRAGKQRGQLYRALKGLNLAEPIDGLVGCSLAKLKKHIEKQFTGGMTWENYGAWHCDHIKPVASYDVDDPEQLQECFNYTNLQPLWAADNIQKGSKYEEEFSERLFRKRIPRQEVQEGA